MSVRDVEVGVDGLVTELGTDFLLAQGNAGCWAAHCRQRISHAATSAARAVIAEADGGLVQAGMDEPGRDPGAGDVADQLLAPLDGHVLEDQQADGQGTQVRVGGYRRVRYSRRAGRDVLAPAAAYSQVQVMLDAARGRLGYLQLLERPGRARLVACQPRYRREPSSGRGMP